MKITHTGRTSAPAKRRDVEARRGDAAAFARHFMTAPAGDPSDLAPGAPLTALGTVLSVQEVASDTGTREHALVRGHGLLDQLEGLRLALVDGRRPEDLLRRLATFLGEARPQAGDPRLAAVLDEVELRAAVELAKLEREQV